MQQLQESVENLEKKILQEEKKEEVKVVIFSRQNCHLCHEAEKIVREVLSEISFDVRSYKY